MKKLQELIKICTIKIFNGNKCPLLAKIETEYKNEFNIQHYCLAYNDKMSDKAGIKIGKLYDSLEHDPENVLVNASYRKMADEVLDQFHFLQSKQKIDFEPYEKSGEPYKNSFEMLMDIHNFHLYFFKTENGFGEENSSPSNIMLEKTGIFIRDYELLINDVFRIVHDIFGHATNGFGFGPKGEDMAWFTHSQMFSPLARAAVTTETRGQNCWVNFGPHMCDEGKVIRKGQKGWVHPAKRPFAEQKMNLMPSSVSGIRVHIENNEIKAHQQEGWDPFMDLLVSDNQEYLETAYNATTYAVYTESETFNLKVGVANSEFQQWCEQNNINSWAVITAYNPFSEELSNHENELNNQRLKEELLLKNYSFLKAEGIPSNTDWESELSYFIWNISINDAILMGCQFKQNAIVHNEDKMLPKLTWLTPKKILQT